MRLLSLSLLLLANPALAQTAPVIDCDAVKSSANPVELAYHAKDGTKTLVQVYPEKPGNYVVWTRQMPPSTQPKQPVFVAKAIFVDGAITSGELSTTFAGKHAHRTATYRPDGLPRDFDRRSDLTYRMHAVTTDAAGSTDEKTSTISYKFKSEETTSVGPCVLQVVHGESETANDTPRTRHTFLLYFPELKISAWATDAEPILDSLGPISSEIKPVN